MKIKSSILAVLALVITFTFASCNNGTGGRSGNGTGSGREAPPAVIIGGTAANVDIVMHIVPGGDFQMGKELGTAGSGDVTPVKVTLTGFYIGKYEVTQKQYKAVMGTSSSPGTFQGDNLPVDGVTWLQALEFCNKLSEMEKLQKVYDIKGDATEADWTKNGYRLPTEAEWEYAAKGGKTPGNFTYSGSNTSGDVAWCDGTYSGSGTTREVGKKQANGLGLHDMSGNVFEWCWDIYQTPYQGGNNPKGPSGTGSRVTRGGSWDYAESYLRSVNRFYYFASSARSGSQGFRVVLPLSE